MREVTFAATQMACSKNSKDNIDKAVNLIESAAKKGANVILIQELFETQYFCKDQKEELFELAKPFEDNPTIHLMSQVAKDNNVVLPVSFFEKSNKAHFNTIAMIDSDGTIMGRYRKSHIPDGPGYQEKFYFNPGNTGFKVWDTKFCKVGVGICWDQWSSEAAKIMALKGAEVILYPTAIGGEPDNNDDFDSSDMWQRAMIGHAAVNQVPIVASNRIGSEEGYEISNFFYGRSFITDFTGEIKAEASRDKEEILIAKIDLDEAEGFRNSWGIFRDRRPDLYSALLDLDGNE
jgi:N-carbamoylputrescine amidase|tara:strand:- start:146 stop:1018 length:873 start_codon:yes stop_codon:yes gene_type:complete